MTRSTWAALVGIGVVASCATPDAGQRTNIVGPDRASFAPVAAFVGHRCGSLDCHGSRYRNLRIWGHDGMRLAVGDTPGGAVTTADELDATYQSIVELEPEAMSAVVADHGASPERLTLVRKARGVEKHTGGSILVPGDPRDACIVSWLSGSTDAPACGQALSLP